MIKSGMVDFNTFLKKVKLKKQYVKNLKSKTLFLNSLLNNNYKTLNSKLFTNKCFVTDFNDYVVTYIIDLNFSPSNTFLHVMNYSGHLKFFYSSGSFKYFGKNKKSRYVVFRDFYKTLISKLKFLKGNPIALHLKNVGYNKSWIIKKLKKKFFIKCIRNFSAYPYNGCRKPKIRRKKF
jgi:ribosomal protein S11